MATVTSPGASIGAEISDIDVRDLSPEDEQIILDAFLEYSVIAIRGQDLDPQDFLNYASRFGEPVPHITRKTRHKGYPQITTLGTNRIRPDGAVDPAVAGRGENWHSDGPYLAHPPKATQLYALEIPSFGGNTQFASLYAAYSSLPDDLRQEILDLEVEFMYGGKVSHPAVKLLDGPPPPAVRHAAVTHHRETGKPVLYAVAGHFAGIVGMGEHEGDELIERLRAHREQPGHSYDHVWQAGDVVTWDNRCLLHRGAGGFPLDEPRIHYRTTIMEFGEHNPDAES